MARPMKSEGNSMHIPKKRKIVSCQSCRKLKTRCDKVDNIKSCYRCSKLRIVCSLEGASNSESTDMESHLNAFAKKTVTEQVKKRNEVTDIEANAGESPQMILYMERLLLKLDTLEKSVKELTKEVESVKGHKRDETKDPGNGVVLHNSFALPNKNINMVPNNLINDKIDNIQLDFYVSSAPMSMTKQIDQIILQKPTSEYESFRECCNEFISLFNANRKLYLNMGKLFLKISHFWIIPGGIKKINSKYVMQHPFISCIFVLIGMCFDQSDSHVDHQRILFDLAVKLLGKALLVNKLTDHDIEAMLYITLFNITRKYDLAQFKLNKWLVTTFAFNHTVLTFNFHEMFQRVLVEKNFDKETLFHLRIYGATLVLFLQASLDCSRPIFVTSDYMNFAKIILRFPEDMLLIGDKITVSRLDLLLKVITLVNNEDYSLSILKDLSVNDRCSKFIEPSGEYLVLEELQSWKQDNRQLVKSDIAKILLNSYYYYYIYLCQRILKDIEIRIKVFLPLQNKVFPSSYEKSLKILKKSCFKTMIKYCFKVIDNFLKLNAFFIKGSPVLQNDQIIYACLILLNSLAMMSSKNNKKTTIELIGKVYWKLNKMGIRKNDATDTLEKVLKLIVDIAIKDHDINLSDEDNNTNSEKRDLDENGMCETEIDINECMLEDNDLDVFPDIMEAFGFSNNESENEDESINYDELTMANGFDSPETDSTVDIDSKAGSHTNSIDTTNFHGNNFLSSRLNSIKKDAFDLTESSAIVESNFTDRTIVNPIMNSKIRSFSDVGELYSKQREKILANHKNLFNLTSGFERKQNPDNHVLVRSNSSIVSPLNINIPIVEPKHSTDKNDMFGYHNNFDSAVFENILLPDTSDYDNFIDFYKAMFMENEIQPNQ